MNFLKKKYDYVYFLMEDFTNEIIVRLKQRMSYSDV